MWGLLTTIFSGFIVTFDPWESRHFMIDRLPASMSRWSAD
jgi:hypothetical protein